MKKYYAAFADYSLYMENFYFYNGKLCLFDHEQFEEFRHTNKQFYHKLEVVPLAAPTKYKIIFNDDMERSFKTFKELENATRAEIFDGKFSDIVRIEINTYEVNFYKAN